MQGFGQVRAQHDGWGRALVLALHGNAPGVALFRRTAGGASKVTGGQATASRLIALALLRSSRDSSARAKRRWGANGRWKHRPQCVGTAAFLWGARPQPWCCALATTMHGSQVPPDLWQPFGHNHRQTRGLSRAMAGFPHSPCHNPAWGSGPTRLMAGWFALWRFRDVPIPRGPVA